MHEITIIDIQQHSFWNPISSFVLSADTYPNWSIFCIREGELQYELPHESGIATFGDLIVCPPHIPMKRSVVKELTFHFFQFSYQTAAEMNLQSGKFSINDHLRLSSNYSMLELIAFMENDLCKIQKVYILNDFFQIYSFENNERKIDNPKINDPIINEALDYINEHAFQSINLKGLASSLGFSPVQFLRRFRKSVGVTPQEYITYHRLRYARKLLLETENTIDDIAIQCGYSNGFYFSRIFTAKMKMPPSTFRKTHLI